MRRSTSLNNIKFDNLRILILKYYETFSQLCAWGKRVLDFLEREVSLSAPVLSQLIVCAGKYK